VRVRYQRGYLRLGHRKCGPDCWEFLWWDREPTGIRIRRKAIIGSIQQYPNVEDAWQASNGLRVLTILIAGVAELLRLYKLK